MLALATAAFVMCCLLVAPIASAQDHLDPPGTTGTDDVSLTLGPAGPATGFHGWVESGPVVPLLALATVVMLFAGAMLLWRRCRLVATPGGGDRG